MKAKFIYKASQLFGILVTSYAFYVSERTLKLFSMVRYDDFLFLPFTLSNCILFAGMANVPSLLLRPLVSELSKEKQKMYAIVVWFFFMIHYVAFPALLYITYTYQLESTAFTIWATILALPLSLGIFFTWIWRFRKSQ